MKDLFAGKTPLRLASMYVVFFGGLLWVISGLAAVDFVGRTDSQAPFIAVLLARAIVILAGSYIIWRCSSNAAPSSRRLARLLVILAVLLFVAFLSAVLPAMLART
jgi:hypothetical protein